MSERASPPEDDPLPALNRLLRDFGIWEACRLHRNRHIDRTWRVSVQDNRRCFPAETQVLIELFLVGAAVEGKALGFVSVAVLDGLIEEGVFGRRPGGQIQSNYQLAVVDNLLLLHEEFRDPTTSVYFGEDSEFYANMLEIPPGARCLDLCTGTGVQALVSLGRGARAVDAVDLNPRALRLARLNARLNGQGERLRCFEGDLFEPLPPGTYDRILCNPPLLPIPAGVVYPVAGDGGPDGLGVVRRILDRLEERLAPGGKFLSLGLSIGGAVPEIASWQPRFSQPPFRAALYLLAKRSVKDYARDVIQTVQHLYPGENPMRMALRFREMYDAAGLDSVTSYFLAISREPAGGVSGTVNLTRSNHSRTYWFAGRP
jgi:SAM-dependent methyltransferase